MLIDHLLSIRFKAGNRLVLGSTVSYLLHVRIYTICKSCVGCYDCLR